MKKIMFFIESLAGGGAEKVLSDIVCNLDKTKFDTTVYTVSDTGVYVDKVRAAVQYHPFLEDADYHAGGIRKVVYWVKMKMIYSLPIGWVYRWLIRDKFDAEIAFVEGFATKLVSASTNSKSRKIAWVHTDMEQNPYAESNYSSRERHIRAYKNFHRICCVSDSVMNAFKRLFFNDESIVVQYNPVDSVAIIQNGEEQIELIPNKTLQLGTIGRLENQKGFIRLINSLGEIQKENRFDFSLWIMGDGSQRTELEKLIKQNRLQKNVKLLGFQVNPYKYMSKCDAFVCSSYAEGFSTAATEALILGKPIFTTECAGMRELFGDEQCGMIVPNTDEALFKMLKELLSGGINPKQYTGAVRSRSQAFDIKSRMKEIEELLNK